MSVILFYSPFDQRSRDNESLMIAFHKQGHRVISLSQAGGAQIHEHLRQHGIETYTHVLPGAHGLFYYLKHLLFLTRFCKKHKVDVLYSHLEPANLVSSVAQYFIKARVYIVRHHINEAKERGFDRSLSYRLTYSLAKYIIVVSNQAKEYMIREEHIPPGKIIHVNLAYDFRLYPKPDFEQRRSIENHQLTLLSAGRFSKPKRTDLSVHTLKLLRDRGIDARLILLGEGDEKQNILKLANDLGLSDHVSMPGYVPNITDYMSVSDFLLHPSIAESSCVVVKEAAIAHLPVIVCNGVGDFDDYVEHEKSGFIVPADDFATHAADIIQKYQPKNISQITFLLEEKVKAIFSIENVVSQYEILNRA